MPTSFCRRQFLLAYLLSACSLYVIVFIINVNVFNVLFIAYHQGLWDETIRERTLQYNQEVVVTDDDIRTIKSKSLITKWNGLVSVKPKYEVSPVVHWHRLMPRAACFHGTTTVIVVVTSPMQHSVRSAIRSTWASALSKWPNVGAASGIFRVIFAMGIDTDSMWNEYVAVENKEHGDILQGVNPDIRLTPHVLPNFILKWICLYCGTQFRYLTYVSDDTFVHIPSLLTFFNRTLSSNVFITPREIVRGIEPSMWSKLKSNLETSPSRNIFIMSSDLLKLVYQAASAVTLNVESDADIYATFATEFNATMVKSDLLLVGNSKDTSVCDVTKGRVTILKSLSDSAMLNIWQQITDTELNPCDM